MGFYNNLDEDEKDQYDVAKESYDTFKGMLSSASKSERSVLRKSMRADRATMRSIANGQRWDMFSTNKHAQRALGKAGTNGLQAAKGAKNFSPAQKMQGLQGVGTALQMFKIAGQALDGVTGALGLNTEQVNQSSADRAGMGGANKLTGLINKIPGAQFMTAFGATNIENATESAYWNSVGSGFTGTRADTDAAKDLGGKRMLFGAKKAQAFVDTSNAQNAAITRIGMESELARQNDVGQLYQQQNFNKYRGHSPSLLLSKKGGVIPELDSARVLLRKLDAHKVRGLNINALLADINTLFNPDQKNNIASTVSQLVADSKDGLSSKDISDLIKNQMLDVDKDPQAIGIKIVENIISNKKELAKILKKNSAEQFIPILDDPNNMDNIKVLGEILSQISANKSYAEGGEITKYQLGGKITSNYIPEGALHRNKHHIEDVAPELDGQITEKGIPVVSMQEGGVQQHAEIEENELTLSLPTTKKIEEYYEEYKKNPSEELLIECGKYFVNEVLYNTEDPGKLIKEL